MNELTKRENYELEELEEREEEILVTNAAIKATDVLALIGAGAFTATGIICLIDKLKKRRKAKSKEEFQNILIQKMLDENCSFESINSLKESLKEYF